MAGEPRTERGKKGGAPALLGATKRVRSDVEGVREVGTGGGECEVEGKGGDRGKDASRIETVDSWISRLPPWEPAKLESGMENNRRKAEEATESQYMSKCRPSAPRSRSR